MIIHGGRYVVGEGDIVSEEILITVRGCNTADWYVNPINGNDNNSGTSKALAFKTVDKALSKVDGEKNIITLMPGEHTLSKAYQITNDTNIITCPNDDVLVWCDTQTFFRVMQDRKLYLQNIKLRHKCCVLYAKDTLFVNRNNLNTNPIEIKVHKQYCMVETKVINFTVPETMIYSDKYTITGKLVTVDDGTVVANEEMDLYIDGELHSTVTTNANGVFTINNISFLDVNTHTFQVKHKDHKNSNGKTYCRCETEIVSRKVNPIPVTLTAEVSAETKMTNALTPENRSVHALIKSFSIKDYKNNIPPGTLQLIEGTSILETINTSNTAFNYIPTVEGNHTYTLKYIPEHLGYESKTITLTTVAVKTNVVITYSNTEETYAFEEPVIIEGTIKTEDGFILEYGTLKIGLSSLAEISHTNGIFNKSFTGLALGQYTCTAQYTENSFFKSATKTFSFRVIEVGTVVYDTTLPGEHQDVTILDTVPSDTSSYADDDLILVHEGNYPKLLLQDTLDTTDLTEEDIVLLNDDEDDLDVLIVETKEEDD